MGHVGYISTLLNTSQMGLINVMTNFFAQSFLREKIMHGKSLQLVMLIISDNSLR
jgi:hypothetical protein